jgi:curved DNA-binding protein CbpA
MKHDLYKILKIRKNASAGAIESAFRRRSMSTHPDRGGDQEEFILVKLAYDVLSDPERRERYDRTGEYEETKPDNSNLAAVSILTQVFAAVAQAIHNQGKDPTRLDVLEGMRAELKGAIDGCHTNHREIEKQRAFITKFSGRFTTERSSNFLESYIVDQITRINAELEKIDQRRAQHEQALELLKDFVYTHEAAERPTVSRQLGTLLGTPVFIRMTGI